MPVSITVGDIISMELDILYKDRRQYIILFERMHDEHNAIRMGLTYLLIDEPTAWREKVNTISHKKKEGEISLIARSV